MSTESLGAAQARTRDRSRIARLGTGRNRYLVAALCEFYAPDGLRESVD